MDHIIQIAHIFATIGLAHLAALMEHSGVQALRIRVGSTMASLAAISA